MTGAAALALARRRPFAYGVVMLVAVLAMAVAIAFALHALGPREAAGPLSEVRTIAGSGKAGTDDGPALDATFLQPAAVTRSRDGTLYVADAVAQRVRAVTADGRVVTVAGGGEVETSGLAVLGDYRNGSGAGARFNRPIAVAAGPDGALYVADELNHCIRRIANNVVSTYAGNPYRAGREDGPLHSAAFTYPRSLSFDGDGTLYVADFGTGVRRIARDGTVTTLALPGMKPTFTGVSATGKAPAVTVFIANGETLGMYRDAPRSFRQFSITEGDGAFGFPYAVEALSSDEAVFSDIHSHAVRYFRAPHEPAITQPLSRIIAGAGAELPDRSAGFADGASLDARFDAPSGLAVSGDAVVVADAGNRRLRSVPLPNRRRPVYDLRDFDGAGSGYRIVYLSNSFSFWNALWDDSIPGQLERRLIADKDKAGFPNTPRVAVVRIDGVTDDTFRQYVDQVLSSGVADLVVYDVNPAQVVADISHDKKLANYEAWANYVADELKLMQKALHDSGSQFFVVAHPGFNYASPLEAYYTRETSEPQQWSYDQLLNFGVNLSEAVRRSGVPSLDLFPLLDERERAAAHVPLYEGHGDHMSATGNRLIAGAIADALERAKPWAPVAEASPDH